MNIGVQLQNLLEQDGLTQKQLAKALDISATTLNGYIKDRRQPDAKTVIRLASYFHTTTDYIYGLTTHRKTLAMLHNTEEKYLVNLYRGISEDNRPLYIEIGRSFAKFEKKKKL